jgi:hypothetical protein
MAERSTSARGWSRASGQEPDLVRDVLQPDVGALLERHNVVPGGRPVGRVDHQHDLVVKAVDRTVVHEGALVGEERGVLHAARGERRDVIAGNAIHQGVPVGAGDLELAHMVDVEDANGGPDRGVLGENAGRVLDRHLVAGERHHLGAEGHVGVVDGGALEAEVGHERLGDAPPIRAARSAFWT